MLEAGNTPEKEGAVGQDDKEMNMTGSTGWKRVF